MDDWITFYRNSVQQADFKVNYSQMMKEPEVIFSNLINYLNWDFDTDLIKKSMNLSLHWADRSKNAFGEIPHKALFGIIQGGLFDDLRLESLNGLQKINFDGYAIGGLAVGESQSEMFRVLDLSLIHI